MSSLSSSRSSSGPRAKCDQVIFEAICKAAEVICHARCPPHSQQQAQSARFNLQLPEVDHLRSSLMPHRQSLHLPLLLEVYCKNQLVERWSLEYTAGTENQHSFLSQQQAVADPIVALRRVCKTIVIWLRTLVCRTRMLPAFTLRGPDLVYRLSVKESAPVSQFESLTSPPVPTPYGVLVYKCYYAPHVQKLTTRPIPIVNATTLSVTTNSSNNNSAAQEAKSAPMRENYMHQHQQRQQSAIATSFDRFGLLKKTHSNNLEEHHHDSASSLSHRAALHDPPTYAYNNTTTTEGKPTPWQHQQQSLSATPLLSCSPATTPFAHAASSIPPLSSTPPTTASNLAQPPATPPFRPMPCTLGQLPPCSKLQEQQQVTQLDLLHSSPFHHAPDASLLRASLLPSSTRLCVDDYNNSGAAGEESTLDDDDQEQDIMPFAVDDDEEETTKTDRSMSFAQKCGPTAHRLNLLQDVPNVEISLLSQQLAEFKSFGANLTTSS